MIKWDGRELWEYASGSIISGVPVRYFDNDKDAMAYRKKHRGSKFWRDNVKKLMSNFDLTKFSPLYYCLQCKRLEDGAHRLFVADKKGISTINVQIGANCYKHNKAIREMDLLALFYEVMDELPTSHKLDRKWLHASVTDKWPLFASRVNFFEKSFLDIGCNVGYSCIEAWRRGARRILGVDVRGDVLAVAERVAATLGIVDEVQFRRMEWKPGKSDGISFDIVMIMGLLHYFPKDQYKAIVKELCDICKETLILELRIIGSNRSKLMTIGRQTLPTTQWLKDVLNRSGFLSIKQFIREKQRELWICERQ